MWAAASALSAPRGSAAGAAVFYAALGFLFGDPRASWSALGQVLPASVLYDVVLTPFVLPLVAALSRRLDPDTRL